MGRRRVWRRLVLPPLASLVFSAGAAAQVPAQTLAWPSESPPPPLPARDVKFPPYSVETLSNGLQVMVVLHHEQPAVTIRLLVGAGGASDPENKPGVASLLARLLDQGTTTRTAEEIADTIDSIGGVITVGAGVDLSFASSIVMKDSFELGMTLVADIARRPALAAAEIERQRQQMLSGLTVSNDDPGYVAGIVFSRLVYGLHPYGQPLSGTLESVRVITRDDLRAFHETYFTPHNSVLAVVGDVTAEEAFEAAERAFGDWPRREFPVVPWADPPGPTHRVVVIDRPGAVQTTIRVGQIGVSRKNADYMALELALRILGGEGSNRLQQVLRSERGLTYAASAEMLARKHGGDFMGETDTRSAATAEALRLMVDEFWRLQRDRVGQRELGGAQAYLAGSFPLTIETPNAIASHVLNSLFFGLDLGELETFGEQVNAVTVNDIQRVARSYLQPGRLSIVMVGDASTFVGDLAGVGFGRYEVVPIDELDLSSVDFRRPQASEVAGAQR